MPQISTNQFGVIDYTVDDIFEFPNGLPGFEGETRFLCIERPALRPVVFLQSVEKPELCFVTLPAQSVDPRYELAIGPEDRTVLGLANDPAGLDQSLACLAIVCLPDDGQATANLLGPVVLSRETRKGVQAVRDDRRYSALTPLASPTKEVGVGEAGQLASPGERFAEV